MFFPNVFPLDTSFFLEGLLVFDGERFNNVFPLDTSLFPEGLLVFVGERFNNPSFSRFDSL